MRLPEHFSIRLERAVRDAEKTYNAGLYSPCLTAGRRAMEGIFKELADSSETKSSLYNLIEEALESDETKRSLKALSHAIRKGGNLGAHFDQDEEPDQEIAFTVLELLEYLIDYFFLLPEKIKSIDGDWAR